MNTKFLFISVLLCILSFQTGSQVREQYALASKMFYYNSGGLINQGSEILTNVSDSSSSAFSYSMKTLEQFEGIFYQVYSSNKVETGMNRTMFRKSSDGVIWTQSIRAGDAPQGKNEYYQNIYVWRKNNNVNVGVVFIDKRAAFDQVRFSLSTNGGNSFLPSIQVSTHTDNSFIHLGGITGKGDTIAVTWSRESGFLTNFSRTTDGGATWSQTSTAYSGGFFNIISDVTIDNNSNIYTISADDQFFKVNLVVRKSTNLGSSWLVMPQITSVTIQQLNHFQQCRFFNNKLYTIWERNMNVSGGNVSDGIFLSESSNGASSWSTPADISDADTLYASSSNFPNVMHPSIAFTPGGVMYAVWSDSRGANSPTFDSCKFNVRLSRSTNGGATWSPNIIVNGPSNYSRVYNSFAAVSVKSTGGIDSVLVTWTKLRNIYVNAITQISTEIPSAYKLKQNYPNPFNPSTFIEFSIPKSSVVQIIIYDMLGRVVEKIVDARLSAGSYKADWNASAITSGVYFYRLIAGDYSETKKMILLK